MNSNDRTDGGIGSDSRGAILFIGVVMGVLLVGALFHVASIGDGIIWRERAQDAADAAAFENAVWHARGMNVVVAINIVMSLVLAVLVIWRMVLLFVTIALILSTILCIIYVGCPVAEVLGEVEEFMLEYDDDVYENVHRVLAALRPLEVAVATVTPAVAKSHADENTFLAYDVRTATTTSASLLLPSKGAFESLGRCFSAAFGGGSSSGGGSSAGSGAGSGSGPGGLGTNLATSYLGDSFGRLGGSPRGFGAGFDVDAGSNRGGDFETGAATTRLGIGVSLPVEEDSHEELCNRAIEQSLDGAPAMQEFIGFPGAAIGAVGGALSFLGGIVESLPALFCEGLFTGNTRLPSGIRRLLNSRSKAACIVDGITRPDKLRKCIRSRRSKANAQTNAAANQENGEDLQYCARPAKVWERAANGNPYMRSFAEVIKDTEMIARDDDGLDIADIAKDGNLVVAEPEPIRAQAEVYFDCPYRWVARESDTPRRSCKVDAMWKLRWKARLRRVRSAVDLASETEPGLQNALRQILGATRFVEGIPTTLSDLLARYGFRETVPFERRRFESAGEFVARHASRQGIIH